MEYPRIPGAALLAAALLAGQASAGEVRVAVATKLAEPIRLVAASFEKDTGNKVHYTVAPTSAFLQQIAEGADFDVLLPNNKAALSELEALDRVVPGTRHTYAQNVLVLWSPFKDYVDDQGQVLRRNQFQRLSVASPNRVYGRPAAQVLDNLGLAKAVEDKLVERHDLAQSRQFVTAGGADLGIVTLSQVYANGKLQRGSAWLIPQTLYDPIEQQAVILKPGRDNPVARSFLFYLRGPKAGSILISHGYRYQLFSESL